MEATPPAARGSNFLAVDEGMRPRANSDPTMGTGCLLPVLLPEITVEDCTDGDLLEHHQDQGGLFGLDATPRRRANTCPEDLFRKRNGRPPTPPPATFRKGPKFKSGFRKPVLKESVSFTHHRLTKLAESEDAEEPQKAAAPGVERRHSESVTNAKHLRGHLEQLGGQLERVGLGEGTDRDAPGCGDSAGEGVRAASDACSPQADVETGDKGPEEIGNNPDSVLNQPSSVKCRFSQTTPPALDSKQLQAC